MAQVLVHICCGPCSLMPVIHLKDQGHNIIGWFRNPNIQPLAEYLRRRENVEICAHKLGIEVIYEDDWDIANWLAKQLPKAGQAAERCAWCCQSRLEAAWLKAESMGAAFFTTTLLYSRYQPHEVIRSTGFELEKRGRSKFYYQDFRQYWHQGIELSKEWNIYRQPYCGCIFSEAERYARKLGRLKNENDGHKNA